MELFRHRWQTEHDRKGILVLIHGTGEHHGRYQQLAIYLNQHGWDVHSGDLPGWGRSPGLKGHIDAFDQYLATTDSWVEEAVAESAGQPVFLLGHSLGGLIVARYTQVYGRAQQLKGAILSSPLLQLKMTVPAWQISLAALANRIWPTLRLHNNLDASMVSRDVEIQQAYLSDPLNYAKVSVRWFFEIQQEMARAWEDRERFTIPLLVMQAGADQIVDADAVEHFVAGIDQADLQWHRFPGLQHEIFNEPERQMVYETVVRWLENRTS